MPVTPPLQKRKPSSEADIEAVIAKGGRPTVETPAEDIEAPKHVNTRLTVGLIKQINTLRSKRPRKPGSPKLGISLQDWILEAVLEKLKRETK